MPDRRLSRLVGLTPVALLFAMAGLAGCPAGEAVLRVRGTVVDPAAHPLPDVSVALQAEGRQPHTSTTDAEGAFQTSIVGATRAKVTFSKTGFQPAEAAADTNTPPLRIVLQPGR